MILTEEQAKTMWCPQARVRSYTSQHGATHNRWEADDDLWGTPVGSCCIASECMMWRWGKIPANYRSSTPRDGWEHITDDDDLAEYDASQPFWLEPNAERDKRRLGWCGLAGRVDHA